MARESASTQQVPMMSVTEADALLGMSRRSSYAWAKGGMPGVVRRGRSLHVLRPAFLRGLGLTEDDLASSQTFQRGGCS